jgi:hypothetical protein
MLEKKHYIGLRVDYGLKIMIENIFSNIPSDMFIPTDNHLFLYLNYKNYMLNTNENGLLENIKNDDKYKYFLK